MRDHPRAPRDASPLPPPPRSLSDELGDFMSSSDEYNNHYDDDDDNQSTASGGLETPLSSRKSSQSDDFDGCDDRYEEEPFPSFFRPMQTSYVKKFARVDEEAVESRPGTAVSLGRNAAPAFRRSSTCPVVLTQDFLASAADEVVRMMPGQAEFMKGLVEGWKGMEMQQRRSSVGGGEVGLRGRRGSVKRPHTAPGGGQVFGGGFKGFPVVKEREEDGDELRCVEEEEEESLVEETERESSMVVEDEVEETLYELRDLARERAEEVIAASARSADDLDKRFAVVSRCIDTIGRMYERKAERGRKRRKLGVKCVNALVRICEMFASEAPDGGAYRFESRFLDGESEWDSDADDEADDGDAEEMFARAWGAARGDAEMTMVGDDEDVVPPSPTKDPNDDKRHAELVRQAREQLDTLFAKVSQEDTPFEERHSRVVYAVEAYLARLSELEAVHDKEFRWHSELKAFHVAMGSRRILSPEPGMAMALVASLSFCFTPIATVLWYVTEPGTTWMLWRMVIPIGCYFLLLAGFYIDQKHARDALYEEMLPAEAREMRRRHKRERELLQMAHDRAVQKVYSPEA
ncbi:hypothetical protein C8035_v002488 [Colletotrichum spinosum]|uniref:Uncharacterized protein n=1 Tax=Colletotrichum spinosum TaxID=1347390 RepID=A0A4R8PXF5_9PEZI|nr:hypothetical protein C8035_v002488 [Colletotrichum spinosum]